MLGQNWKSLIHFSASADNHFDPHKYSKLCSQLFGLLARRPPDVKAKPNLMWKKILNQDKYDPECAASTNKGQ